MKPRELVLIGDLLVVKSLVSLPTTCASVAIVVFLERTRRSRSGRNLEAYRHQDIQSDQS